METNYQFPNLPNITPLVMENEKNLAENKEKLNKENEDANKKSDYKKNYLNVTLNDGEKEKTLTIRLLPMDLDPQSKTYGTPFVHVYSHNVKVPKEISKSGYKTYLCLAKTNGIDHSKFGYKCPFCEINKAAYDEGSQKEKGSIEQKELYKLSTSNLARESVIVRCIDRDHEDEGVKFWKFNIRDDKTDPYNQIMALWKLRAEEGMRAGQELNILDVFNGVDLTIKITDGNSAPTITDGRISCPVSKDPQKLQEWLYDKKTWQEVFTPKTYEYLKLVSAMKIPWKDKESGLWVDKDEFMNSRQEMKRSKENEISDAEAALLSSGQNLVESLTINDLDIPM